MAASPADNEVLSVSTSPLLKMTENKMGFMLQASDEYCDAFFGHIRSCAKPARVADLGVAFGYTTKLLLQCEADVTANDLSKSHLQ